MNLEPLKDKIVYVLKETETILVHPAVASLSPNNPSGIESLLRVVNGEVRYLDLNEELLLDWMLRKTSLDEVVSSNKSNSRFSGNLRRPGLDNPRVEEVVERAGKARDAFADIQIYQNFPKFVEFKRILEDAAKIISAPFISDEEAEYLRIHHNTVGYYNSQFQNSRESLLRLTQSAGLFKTFIHEHAIPLLLESDPKMVGISVSHPDQYVFAFQLAHQLRLAKPEVITLFGGSTITRRLET